MAHGQTQFDIISNFIIMLVIADFDNYFYAVRNYDSINALLSDEKYLSIFIHGGLSYIDSKISSC